MGSAQRFDGELSFVMRLSILESFIPMSHLLHMMTASDYQRALWYSADTAKRTRIRRYSLASPRLTSGSRRGRRRGGQPVSATDVDAISVADPEVRRDAVAAGPVFASASDPEAGNGGIVRGSGLSLQPEATSTLFPRMIVEGRRVAWRREIRGRFRRRIRPAAS